MSFNSAGFIVFLSVVFAVYWALPERYRCPLLLAASYFFYMNWDARYALLLLFITVSTFLLALMTEKSEGKKKKAYLAAAVLICLSILFVFKYYDFFIGSFIRAAGRMGIVLRPAALELLLPVGISFYTFQSLGYVIDVYRGGLKAERSFIVYAAFVSFFPQLVAGPIERAENLLPQFRSEHRFDYDRTAYGLKLMTWGFFKKLIIADYVAIFSDRVFDKLHSYRGFALVLAAFFFTVQIYCDFSAYSDIAKGTAKLFGFELMDNFRSPYFSKSISEFWKRWHISLSTWFRDYVYIPLGGNRAGKLRSSLNLMVTFVLSGLWHGANWTFVIWGAVHGAARAAESRIRFMKSDAKNLLSAAVSRVIVFLFVMFAWVWFRSQSVDDALFFFRHMFDGISSPVWYLITGCSRRSSIGIGIRKAELIRLIISIALLSAYDFASLKTDVIDWIGRRPFAVRHAVYLLLIITVLMFRPISEVEFVYFRF